MMQWSNKYFGLQIMNLMKLICPIYVLQKCLYFFQAKEKGEKNKNYDNDFETFWDSYGIRTIADSPKQTKWNLWN